MLRIEEMEHTMKIVSLNQDDLNQVYEIECACFANPWSKRSLWGDLVAPKTFCYGMKEGERLVGYCSLALVADEGTVLQLAVLPTHRRKGIGNALTAHAIEQAVAAGASIVLLEVRVNNAAARRLYEGLGFEEVSIRKRYYRDNGEDAVVMIWRKIQE